MGGVSGVYKFDQTRAKDSPLIIQACEYFMGDLAATRPNLFVTMATYGDVGTGYILTAKGFKEGGYETGASRVTAEAENVLMNARRNILKY